MSISSLHPFKEIALGRSALESTNNSIIRYLTMDKGVAIAKQKSEKISLKRNLIDFIILKTREEIIFR